jgi:GWxTD domain-containing protein
MIRKPVILLLASLLFWGCATYQLEKSLDPDSRDFLSKVRYLITKEERKTFVNLPASERPKFIDEFWKKRDPNPDTEENEFKEQYFQRIEEANRLFTEGEEPGWLQDRGRIYILLGPPTNRETFPRGVTFYGKPTEIWYYNFFPIVFIDQFWNGHYKLDPDSPEQLAEIMRAQMEWKPQVSSEKGLLDCTLDVKKAESGEALIRVSVPYKKIWMKAEDKSLRTSLSVSLEVRDSSDTKVWEYEKDYPLSLTEEQLEKIVEDDYMIEVPLTLKSGAYMLTLALTNTSDGARIHKRSPVNL